MNFIRIVGKGRVFLQNSRKPIFALGFYPNLKIVNIKKIQVTDSTVRLELVAEINTISKTTPKT